MIKEAIILAGGLGTRLQEALPDLPKSMAPVAGQPFLTYLIRHLLSQGIEKFIFSLGYKHEVIQKFLVEEFAYLNYDVVIEPKALGTGGAVKLAIAFSETRDVLIVNGDTLFKIDVDDLSDRHMESQAVCTLALKPMEFFDRYGAVEIDTHLRIQSFKEKKYVDRGHINGGVYVLNKVDFQKRDLPEVFSFEKDFLEQIVSTSVLTGVLQDKYFIDIGIPKDYQRAQEELRYRQLDINKLDHSWTLFLDRDGVINVNKDDSYVFTRDEFKFISGVKESMRNLSQLFGKIIVLTNQRGVGKGLMEKEALQDIHQYMIEEIEHAGGRVDAVYYCIETEDRHFDRKPNPGMPLEAAHMFADIHFSKSIMAGDKLSDMQLGRNIGAYTVMIHSSQSVDTGDHLDVDMRFDSLKEFSSFLR